VSVPQREGTEQSRQKVAIIKHKKLAVLKPYKAVTLYIEMIDACTQTSFHEAQEHAYIPTQSSHRNGQEPGNETTTPQLQTNPKSNDTQARRNSRPDPSELSKSGKGNSKIPTTSRVFKQFGFPMSPSPGIIGAEHTALVSPTSPQQTKSLERSPGRSGFDSVNLSIGVRGANIVRKNPFGNALSVGIGGGQFVPKLKPDHYTAGLV
jgi:hypothetical protein